IHAEWNNDKRIEKLSIEVRVDHTATSSRYSYYNLPFHHIIDRNRDVLNISEFGTVNIDVFDKFNESILREVVEYC
ncbi:hypothetical protein PFISCL1PPCAC_21201, partial [Pristionchus fissidentatus]